MPPDLRFSLPQREADLTDIERLLQPGEYIVACFVTDLDLRLKYSREVVVLTTRRVLTPARDGGGDGRAPSSPLAAASGWRCWPLDAIDDLRAQDRAGLGKLELITAGGEVWPWRYTAAAGPAAHDLVRRFRDLRSGLDSSEDESEEDGQDLDSWEREPAERKPRAWSLFRLARFARSCTGLIIVGIILALMSTALSLVPPYLTIPLMDDVLIPYHDHVNAIRGETGLNPQQQAAQLAELRDGEGSRMLVRLSWYLLGLGGAAVGAWALAWGQGAVMAWVSERIGANLRNETYAHLLRLSLDYFSKKRTGDLIARISSDTDRINMYLADTVVDFGTDVLMIVGTAIILVSIDPLLAVASLVPLPLTIWLVYLVRSRLQEGFQRGGRRWSEMTSVLADSIPGIRVVKAFAQERRENRRFHTTNDRIVEANDRINTTWTFFWPMVALLNQAGLLVVWAFGAWRVIDVQITVGVLSGFLLYIGRFYVRVESMSRVFSLTERAAASAHRLLEILDQPPRVTDPENPLPIGRVEGHIEFRRVSFCYQSRPVLDGIELDIQPGEMIGLVGHSGAGKTTLINLVCRFYDVTAGVIAVDGVNIRKVAMEDHRRNIGLVLQEPFLFYGTIAENIAYGRPDAAPEEIVAAAQAARAHEFILRLADGYDSMVGERGQSLSGGERQRISIARALLIDPRILILDEATSSVDTETEHEIQLALENLIQGRTTIAIAHRLSTLRRADRLVVLERGQIVEIGPHDELLARGGTYARLYHAQLEMTKVRARQSGRDGPAVAERIRL